MSQCLQKEVRQEVAKWKIGGLMQKFWINALLVCVMISMTTCGTKKGVPTEIRDIAYDVDSGFGYTVYVEENEKYIPYLVLTANYNGNTLLLRKDLLVESHKYGYGDYFGESTPDNYYQDSGYYATSNIDNFLNSDYFDVLSANIRAQILNTDIAITSETRVENNGLFEFGTETISRKVFLLSHTELGLPASEVANDEGEVLKYFKENSIIAYSNGEPCSYWLRSRETFEDNLVWGIGPEGTYGGGDTKSANGVRPAFCVLNSTRIFENEGTYILGEQQ